MHHKIFMIKLIRVTKFFIRVIQVTLSTSSITTFQDFCIKQQECIPVGCVLPAYWWYTVVSEEGSVQHPPPWMQTPPGWRPYPGCRLPWMQTPLNKDPLDADPPLEAHPPDADPFWRQTPQKHPLPRGQKEWQTLVKILLCPKLRLRAVIKRNKHGPRKAQNSHLVGHFENNAIITWGNVKRKHTRTFCFKYLANNSNAFLIF